MIFKLEKYLKLFEIISQASIHLFTIHLSRLMCIVHSVFYISMLEPTIPNIFPSWSELLLSLVIINGESEYEIFQIIDLEINCRHTYKLLYKVI